MARQSSYPEGGQEPDEWRADLNPDNLAGMNYDRMGEPAEVNAGTAFAHKDLHDLLDGFTDDELRQITIVPRGSRLEQGATYIDLSQEQPEEFTAMAGMVAGPASYLAPKSAVDYQLWNRLIGVDNPARTGEGEE